VRAVGPRPGLAGAVDRAVRAWQAVCPDQNGAGLCARVAAMQGRTAAPRRTACRQSHTATARGFPVRPCAARRGESATEQLASSPAVYSIAVLRPATNFLFFFQFPGEARESIRLDQLEISVPTLFRDLF